VNGKILWQSGSGDTTFTINGLVAPPILRLGIMISDINHQILPDPEAWTTIQWSRVVYGSPDWLGRYFPITAGPAWHILTTYMDTPW
jgi:hypothetical protein